MQTNNLGVFESEHRKSTNNVREVYCAIYYAAFTSNERYRAFDMVAAGTIVIHAVELFGCSSVNFS